VLLVAEELLPAPFSRPDADPTFALALHFSADPGRVEPGGLELRATLEGLPADGREPTPSGAGIPSMLPPSLALLRAIARLSSDPSAPPQVVELASCEHPALTLRWVLTLARGS
jgi:hypothetical protein